MKPCRVKYIDEYYKGYPELIARLTNVYHEVWRRVTRSKLFRSYGKGDDATYLFSAKGTAKYKEQVKLIEQINLDYNVPNNESLVIPKLTKAGNNSKVVINVYPIGQQEYQNLQETKQLTDIPNYEVVTRPTKDIGKSKGRTGNFVEITTPDNYRTNMSAYMVQTNDDGKLFITNIEKYNEDSTFKGFGTVAYVDFFENYKNQGITTDKKLTADGIKLLERLEKIGLVYKTNAELIDDTQVSKFYDTKIYEYDKPLYEFNLNWSKSQITPQQKQGSLFSKEELDDQKSELGNIVYSAVFFNTDEVVSKYRQYHSNLYSHHSTIEFKPADISTLPIGQSTTIKIVGRLTTDKVDALIVENPLSKNEFPHITLSTAEGVKPYESNREIENNQDKIRPLNDEIEGVIGVFNGKKEITRKLVSQPQKETKSSVGRFFESYYTNGFSRVPDHKSWYIKDHLEVVQKIVDDLHAKYGGDKSIMDLMVYTHDLAKAINNESKSHRETVKPILENMGYPQSTINEVIRNIEMMDAVKTQDLQDIPIEVRILSTADALSHYTTGNRGFLNIFSTETTMGDMNVIKESNLRKIEKDKRKILLPGFSLNDTKLEYYGRITSVSGSVTNYLNRLLNETAPQKLIEPISDQEIAEIYKNKIDYLRVQNLPVVSFFIFKTKARNLEAQLRRIKTSSKETILEALKCL